MPLPFRNNPLITTNWMNARTRKFAENVGKKAYYELSASKKPGSLLIQFREEKQRLGGSAEKARNWLGFLTFEFDSTFARDLKMFLNEYVDKDPEELLNTVRIFTEKTEWVAKLGSGKEGRGKTIDRALKDLARQVKEVKK